jgi:hypothetical protein
MDLLVLSVLMTFFMAVEKIGSYKPFLTSWIDSTHELVGALIYERISTDSELGGRWKAYD